MTLEILRRFPPEKSVKSCGLNLVRIHERIHGQLPAIESPDIQAIIARDSPVGKNTPNHPDIWWFQAAIAEKLNRSGDALAAMDAIERRFPDNPAVYERRANILSKMNRATAALEYRRKGPGAQAEQRGLHHPGPAGRAGEKRRFFGIRPAHGAHQAFARPQALWLLQESLFNLNCHPTYSGGQIWGIFPRLVRKRGQAGPAGAKAAQCRARAAQDPAWLCLPGFQTTFHGLLHGADFQGPADCGIPRQFRGLCLRAF